MDLPRKLPRFDSMQPFTTTNDYEDEECKRIDD